MNNRHIAIIVIAVALLMMLTSLGGFTAAKKNVVQQEYYLPSNVGGQVVPGMHHVKPISGNKILHVLVSLKFRNQALLSDILGELQNPSSPMYHHYLTSGEFRALFSPSVDTYYGLVQYFQEHGFIVSTYNDRISIGLVGTASLFEHAFGVHLYTGILNGRNVYAPEGVIHLGTPLAASISNVVGLNTLFTATISPLFTGSGSSELLYGADMQVAYQLNQLYQKYGYPTNVTIATILWSGTDSSGASVAPYVPSDISYYFNHNLPAGEPKPIVYGYPIGGAPAPGPSAANDNSQANFESTLDLEMAGSTAPGSHVVEVYGPSATETYLDQAFAAVLNPSYNTSVDTALSHVVAISNSWGGTDTNDSTWMQYEQEAAARGITVLASSGDSGNSNSAAPSFPATMAYNTFGTLAVGGAAMQLTGTTSTDGSGTTGIQTQSVWYNTPQSGDGSQGGVSSIFSEPSWQLNSADANSVITGASSITGVSSGRGTPDVAGDGANMEIYITYNGASSYQELWGTSVASPLVAGVVATLDHSAGSNEGFMNPLIYRMAQAEYNGSYSGSLPFYFIKNGSNADFSATNGYSLVVGWGSINAYNFLVDQSSGVPAPAPSPTPTSSNKIYSQVNATSSNIYTYGLPEAEEFSVGSSSAQVNYIVLYLSGSGTVQVGIGTSLWGDQVLPWQSVTVTSASNWYNITFPTVSLNGGTNYYLTVEGSGSVSWGYTGSSSATVDLNALQDYWYSSPPSNGLPSGTPSSDNSYPDIYTVGYHSTSAPVTVSKYTVSATESGLPSGTTWYFNISGVTSLSGTGTTLSTSLANGSYSYTVSTVNKEYAPSPGSGTLSVAGAATSVSISFSPVTYAVNFKETGLSSGTSWSVTFNGQKKSGTGSTISFSASNGTYSYTVGSVSGYTASPSSGSVSVSGAAVSKTITFTAVSNTQPNGFWAEVTATSANTYFYTLPEAEEFTVGSSNEMVNVVLLFLEGSGTITVGIGTSPFVSNVLSNITITVNEPSTGGWYNLTFPAVSLTGGTHYFLNLNEPSGSGNVQWGYTSSPSTDVNALQDYWFSGSTMYNDNSYPNLFKVGYNSAAVITAFGSISYASNLPGLSSADLTVSAQL